MTISGTAALRLNGSSIAVSGLVARGRSGGREQQRRRNDADAQHRERLQHLRRYVPRRHGRWLSIVKTGAGTMIVSGTGNHTGQTIIRAGTLQFNAAADRPSPT